MMDELLITRLHPQRVWEEAIIPANAITHVIWLS
jgi:hypothetical protein